MTDGGAGRHRFGPSVTRKLEEICKNSCERSGVEHSGFVIFDESQEVGEVVAEYPSIEGLLHQQIKVKGDSTKEKLFESDRPVVVRDVAEAHDLGSLRKFLLLFKIKSICIVKVKLHGRVIGSFSFYSREKISAFGNNEVAFCRTVAVLASSEIERAVEETWHKAFQQATLAIRVEQEEPLLTEIIRQAEWLFEAQTAGLYLRRPDQDGEDSLQLVASSSKALTGKTLRKGEGMAWQLLLSTKPYLTTSDYATYKHRADFPEGEFGAVLEVPLLRRDERIGVLYLSDRKGRYFTEKQAEHLQEYADSAVIAIQHCNLVSRMRDISIESNEMFGNMNSDAPDRLGQIAQKATAILNAEMCGIFFLDESAKWLILKASSGHALEASNIGRKFEVKNEQGSGLTGALAWEFIDDYKKHMPSSSKYERPVTILCGESLVKHPAVKGGERDATPGGSCHSLLAIPLIQKHKEVEHVTGMLRISNKKGADGKPHDSICFDEQDRLILTIFAEAVARALESASLFDMRVKETKELEQKNNLYEQFIDSSKEREANLTELVLHTIKCGLLMHNQGQRVRHLQHTIREKMEELDIVVHTQPATEVVSKLHAMLPLIITEADTLEDYGKVEREIKRIIINVKRLVEILDKEDPLMLWYGITKEPVKASYCGHEMVEVDEVLIWAVFTVFRDNARAAMEITSEKLFTTTLAADEEWCSVRFSDTGTGMRRSTWQEISEHKNPRLETGKSRKGLQLAFFAVRALGGTVDLADTSEQGTTFEIKLPLMETSAKEKPSE